MEAPRGNRSCRERSVNSMNVSDPDSFKCAICYELLSIPIYQCGNGHLVCSSCHNKLIKKNECPSNGCRSHIGNNRNMAIEKVLQSIRVTCKNAEYGYEETSSLPKKNDHENSCKHSPSSGPLQDFSFPDSSSKLYQHFRAKHNLSGIQFQQDKHFKVRINANHKFLVLQEEKDSSILFILQNPTEERGRSLSINCISTKHTRKRYKIRASSEPEYTLEFESITRRSKMWSDCPPLFGYLTVP